VANLGDLITYGKEDHFMDKLVLTISGTEIRNGGTGSYSFNHDIAALKAGSFSGSEIRVNSPDDGTVKSYEMELAAWKKFALALEGTRAMTFAMKADDYQRNWYSRMGTGGNSIAWLSINAYEGSHERNWGSSADQSTQIQDIRVVTAAQFMGFDWISLVYTGITKTYW
jgi:hypothetical protein